jgi:hypothetical protein
VWHLLAPERIGEPQPYGILIGAAVSVYSFAMDYRNVIAGGIPRQFNWTVYATDLASGW